MLLHQPMADHEGVPDAEGTPTGPGTPLEKADIDWPKTYAWGAGGYYARIFYNIRGREPQGLLQPSDVPEFESRFTRELETVRRPDGQPLGVDARIPGKIYREVRGDAPDLMIYFGNATWRSAGTIGYNSLFLDENDTGPDDSVHSFDGIYVVDRPRDGAGVLGPTENLIDIGPTILSLMGVPIPADVQGRPIARFA